MTAGCENGLSQYNKETVRDGSYIPTLDGWRAVAIILVIFAHSSDSVFGFFGSAYLAENVHSVGLFGVQIFFGLSGFLITSRLISEDARYGKISLQSFYIRRAFRILPASLIFLGTVGILAWVGILPVSIGRWLSTLLFLANYSTADGVWYLGHFWSLAVEEHFYFVWPLAFLLLVNMRRRIFTAITIALLVALWRAIDFKFHITGSSSSVFWGRTDIVADFIVWGCALALLYGTSKGKVRLEKVLQRPLVIPMLVMILFGCFAVPNLDWKLTFFLLTVKAATIPLLILAVLINKRCAFHFLLETPPLKLLGRLSYSIYLWQQLFFVWNDSLVTDMIPLQNFPINFLATLVCASLSMVYIERPLIKFGHKLSNRLSALDKKNPNRKLYA